MAFWFFLFHFVFLRIQTGFIIIKIIFFGLISKNFNAILKNFRHVSKPPFCLNLRYEKIQFSNWYSYYYSTFFPRKKDKLSAFMVVIPSVPICRKLVNKISFLWKACIMICLKSIPWIKLQKFHCMWYNLA